MFSFCIWDIPALLLLLAVGGALFVQQRNHKRRMKQHD